VVELWVGARERDMAARIGCAGARVSIHRVLMSRFGPRRAAIWGRLAGRRSFLIGSFRHSAMHVGKSVLQDVHYRELYGWGVHPPSKPHEYQNKGVAAKGSCMNMKTKGEQFAGCDGWSARKLAVEWCATERASERRPGLAGHSRRCRAERGLRKDRPRT
jgi:hypothetical protein